MLQMLFSLMMSEENVKATEALGIRSIHVVDKDTIPEYFRTYDFSAEVE